MSKHTINGWVTHTQDYTGKDCFSFYPFKPASDSSLGMPVFEHTFEVEVPDDFDPRPQQIAALDEEIQKTHAKFTARINELQEQKARLLAIENTVDAE